MNDVCSDLIVTESISETIINFANVACISMSNWLLRARILLAAEAHCRKVVDLNETESLHGSSKSPKVWMCGEIHLPGGIVFLVGRGVTIFTSIPPPLNKKLFKINVLRVGRVEPHQPPQRI